MGKGKDKMFGKKKKNKKTGLFPTKKEGKLKQEMLDGEDTLQTMKMGDTRLMKKGQRAGIMRHMSPVGKYDHSYKMTGAEYDNKEAYNTSLSDSARLHYFENERHDDDKGYEKKGKKKGPFSNKKKNKKTGLYPY